MGRKRPSMAHQMWQKLEEINDIGASRHFNKAMDKACGIKSNKITSFNSYNSYKNASKQFAKWLKEEHPSIKYLTDVTREMGVEYIRHRANEGKSSYTYSQDLVAVNKLLDTNITKSDCKVAKRSLSNRKNNMTDNGFRTKDGVAEKFIEGTGLRRRELQHLKIKNCIMQDNELVGVRVYRGKNGRYRVAEIRQDYRLLLGSIINSKKSNDKLFDKPIPKRLQTHRIRHIYAKAYCEELKSKGLEREQVLDRLTQSLGHNRHDVLKNYGAYIPK